MADDRGKVCGTTFCQRVDRGRDEGDIFRRFQNFYKTLVIDELVKKIDQVDGVLVHAVKEDVRGVQNNAHGDVRVKLMEFL